MDKYQETLNKYNLKIDQSTINKKIREIIENNKISLQNKEVLKFLYSCLDITSLNSNDSRESIWNFTEKINDFDGSRPDMENVAAICVYPNFVKTVKEALTANVKIAAVAGGFPSSQTFMEIKIAEVGLAVMDGADEIDIVLNSGLFFENSFEELCVEIEELKITCRNALLKVILETGLLKTPENIKKAAILAIYSGADFIKTSTGKVYSGASLEAVYIMCEAIKEYQKLHNRKIGLKIAGGISSVQEAIEYYAIVKELLGDEWLTPTLFRIGSSSLANKLLLEIN